MFSNNLVNSKEAFWVKRHLRTHETESPWPSHFKHSYWWKRRSCSKFRSHYAWGTDIVCECEMDVKLHGFLHGIKMYHDHLDYFQNPPFGGRPNTKPVDHGTPNAHNRWFIVFYHVWGPVWIKIHWNIIWLRAQSHMTSHYTWGSVTTLHDFGGVLGWPSDAFFWALTISWSRLLACVACVWSGPKLRMHGWNELAALPLENLGSQLSRYHFHVLKGKWIQANHSFELNTYIKWCVVWCESKSQCTRGLKSQVPLM